LRPRNDTTRGSGDDRGMANQSPQRFRLRAIMRQGTAASLPAVWERFTSPDTARAAARGLYHDDRVLRVYMTNDGRPAQFVEWIER
jgi:hypothetical protein